MSNADKRNLAAIDRITKERVAAGLCRHCGGPVPCWSAFGDVSPARRYTKRTRRKVAS